MIPQRDPGQSFDAHQADMAFWLGTDIHTMNAVHDHWHRALSGWLGVTSHAMREAAGISLAGHERHLAMLEEQATLHVQRWAVACGVGVPR